MVPGFDRGFVLLGTAQGVVGLPRLRVTHSVTTQTAMITAVMPHPARVRTATSTKSRVMFPPLSDHRPFPGLQATEHHIAADTGTQQQQNHRYTHGVAISA